MFKFCVPATALLLAISLAFVDTSAGQTQLLINPGFETGDTTGWSSVGGDLSRAPVSNTGDWGAQLVSDGQDVRATMSQQVTVEPFGTYQLSGWALLNDPNLSQVNFQVLWLDAGGDLLGQADSPWLVTGQVEPGTYTISTTGARVAPDSAVNARVLGTAWGVDGDAFFVYFDDLSFTEVAPPPPTPVPTAPPTPPPTAPPTSTPPPTTAPAPTLTASPIRTPTPTPTPTPRPTPTPVTPPITPGPEPNVFSSLTNGGFEQAGQDGAYGWRKIGGTTSQNSSRKRSGSYSLALVSASTSTKWAYQTVTVQSGAYYRATAYAAQGNSAPGEIFLRVSWYDSGDGSGEAISSDDSTGVIGANSSSFQQLVTDPVQAPSGARSARVRLMFRPAGASSATVYFDDVGFAGTPPPTDPPATPAPTGNAATPAPTTAGWTPTPRPTNGSTNSPDPTDPPASADRTGEPESFSSLVNGSFEEAREDGTPYGWHKVGGSFAVSPANRTEGELGLQITSDTAATKWVYQSVQVSPGAYYRATAWAMNTASGDELILRVSWYPTSNGSGSAISDVDSSGTVRGAPTGFRLLDTGAVRAPSGAHSARIRLLLRPASTQTTHAFFDDARVAPTSAPAGAGSSSQVDSDAGGSSGTDSEGEGGVLGSAATPRPITNGGPGTLGTATPQQSGSNSDWLLALAIAAPALGIGAVLGVPYVRRKFAAPADPPAA